MACRKFHQELPVYQGVNASFAWLAAPYEANSGRRLGLRIRLFLLACRDDLADREHYLRLPPNDACTRWNDTAHIHGRPDLLVPICLDRHNSATGYAAALPRW